MEKNKQIILVGFMGTGKTTTGKILAKKLGVKFIDTDLEIINKEKIDITSIFEKYGEEYFRKCETDVLMQLLKNNYASVISTGGGIVLSAENRKMMKNNHVVLLQASPAEIVKRICEDKERPLLNSGSNLLEKVTNLLAERNDLYEQVCDVKINTDNLTAEEISDIIINRLFSE